MVKLHSTNSETERKFFFTKQLIAKYQFSKSRGNPPATPSDVHEGFLEWIERSNAKVFCELSGLLIVFFYAKFTSLLSLLRESNQHSALLRFLFGVLLKMWCCWTLRINNFCPASLWKAIAYKVLLIITFWDSGKRYLRALKQNPTVSFSLKNESCVCIYDSRNVFGRQGHIYIINRGGLMLCLLWLHVFPDKRQRAIVAEEVTLRSGLL